MATFTLQQMEELLATHEMAEFTMDLDAVMATLVEHPVFEMPGIGLRFGGQEAVRAMYERFLQAGDRMNIWADKRVHAVSENELVREAYVYFDTPEGRVTGQYCVVMAFQDQRILGERFYMDDSFARAMGAALQDEELLALPGVHSLADVVPPPVPRLDRAAAHAANSDH